MNRIFKVIYNRTMQRYEVASELAKNRGKISVTQSARHCGSIARTAIVFATLLGGLLSGGGGTLTGFAADVHDGDTITGSTNISVTKVGSDITIFANGLALQTDLALVQSQANLNTGNIATNTTAIGTHAGLIATNQAAITANANHITTNAAAIGINTTNIVNNTNRIITLETLTQSLGLDSSKPGVKYFRANSTGTDASATGDDAIAIGEKANATRTNSMAIGKESTAGGRESLVLGLTAESTSGAESSIAIGKKAITGAKSGMIADEGGTTVIVNGGKDSISMGTNANARGNSTIALGEGATVMNDSVGGTISSNSMAIGTQARTVASNNATAIGHGAKVANNSDSAIAFGDNAKAEKNASAAIVIGKDAIARGRNSFAAGTTAQTSGLNTIAIGSEAYSGAKDSIVLGTKAGTGMAGDILGTKGSHIVIGNEAGQNVDASQDIAIGYRAGNNVTSDHNIAIGSGAGSNIGSAPGGNPVIGKNVSIGDNANKYTTMTAILQSTAVGSETRAASDAVAVGYRANATGDGSMALGFNAQAADSASMALGQGAQATGGNVAIGSGSIATAAMISGTGYLTDQAIPASAVSVGTGSALRRITNVADGAQDQDAVTVAQLKKSIDETVAQVNAHVVTTTTGIQYDTVTSGDGDSITLRNNNNNHTKIHNVAAGTLGTDAVNVDQLKTAVQNASTHYYSIKSTDSNNYNNDGASGTNAMAAGPGAKALGDDSVSIGNNVEAQGTSSIALGVGYDDGTGISVKTIADTHYRYNTAIGAGAQSQGDNSLALGTRAVTAPKDGTAVVDQAIAIGYFAGASDNKAIAIGSEAKSSGKSATAIGDFAQSTGENALAVGTQSKATGVSSGAIGTQNTVTGSNTYVMGTENQENAASPASTGKNISAVNSGVFGNQNALEGKENRITGNRNSVKKGAAGELEDIMVTGNKNMIEGDATAANVGKLSGIAVLGSGNTIRSVSAPDLQNVQVLGNNNTLIATGNKDLSNTQILGSNVTATQGNSVYLGSNSTYTASGATTKGMDTYTGNGTYHYAGGTPAGIVTVGAPGRERRIQNVAAGLVGTASTDAVNGSQLYTMTRPLRFAGDNSTVGATAAADTNVLHRGSDQAMSILGGADGTKLSDNNIGVVADAANNTITVKLAKELAGLTSVTTVNGGKTTMMTGDGVTSTNGTNTTTTTATGMTTTDGTHTAVVNATGVTITPSTGDPTKTVSLTNDGLNNGGNKIVNVAAGTADTDAVNVSQLKSATHADLGGGFGLTAEDGNSVKKDLGQTISVVGDGTNIATKVENGEIKIELNKDIKVDSVTSTDGTNTTTTTATGMTTTDGTHTAVVNATGVTITPSTGDPTKTVSLTNDGLNNGGNKIVNVAPGEISAISTDAVNGSQIHQLKEEISQQHTAVTVNGGTAAPAAGAGGTYGDYTDGNLQLAQKEVNGKVTYDLKLSNTLQIGKNGENGQPGTNGSIGVNGSDGKSGVGINGNDGLSVKGKDGKDGVTIKGKDGANGTEGHIGLTGAPGQDGADATADIHVIQGQNGVDGTDGAGGRDGMDRIVYEDHNGTPHEIATTEDGLKFGANSGTPNPAANKLNSTVTIVGEGTNADSDYSGTNIKTFISQANGDTTITVKMDKNLSNIDTIAINGKDGHDGSEGAIGLSGKDGISIKGKDGKDAVSIKGEDGIGTIGLNGKDGITTIRTEKGEPGVNGTDGITRIIYKDPQGNEHQGATLDDGMKYSGDTGNQLKMKLNQNVNIKGGISDESRLSDGNIGVVSDGNDTLTVKLSKDIAGLNSVTTETLNATTINGDTINIAKEINVGGKTYINNQGINANNQKVTNVAPGEISVNSTDAVNGSQLHQTNQALSRVGTRVNKVGAGAAALAALHPLDFDPDDKWNVAAGYGNYRSEHAAAVGAFYRPDENTMFSVGASVGNGENMVNAGVTFALDRKSRITTSRTAMARDMLDMQKHMMEMQAQMDKMANVIGQLTGTDVSSTMFPDVPENHWAYEYIESLQKKGIIEGYPDGEFKGDRSMTRYEYAAMLYRALLKGERLDARAATEFAPELGRIRVDRIAGEDNDRNKIERVRVNNEDKETRDVYGSKIQIAAANAK